MRIKQRLILGGFVVFAEWVLLMLWAYCASSPGVLLVVVVFGAVWLYLTYRWANLVRRVWRKE